MKNVFDGHISTLDTTKERIIELKGRSTETSQTEMQIEKKNRKELPQKGELIIQELEVQFQKV